jgi:hypothetical protein
MFDEGPEQPRVRRADHGIAVQPDFDFAHGAHSTFEIAIADEIPAAPTGFISVCPRRPVTGRHS